ncbi:MAG: phosphotransferase [Candidatus Heimdallarchaeota archaeon]|nr:phosphotransferase [Candidatus Heimdallarchaeota archaeon]
MQFFIAYQEVVMIASLSEDSRNQICNLYSLQADQLISLGSFENFIYEVQEPVHMVIRVGYRKDEEAVKGEVEWLHYLSTHDLPVIKPLPSVNGNLYEKIFQETTELIIVAFSYAPGKIMGAPDSEDWKQFDWEYMGQVLGRMHRLSSEYKPEKKRRKNFLDTRCTSQPETVLSADDPILEEYLKYLKSFSQQPTTSDIFGLIHGDLHHFNFHVKNNLPYIFDFDDCWYSWYIHDIAILIYDPVWYFYDRYEDARTCLQDMMPRFWRGYRRENHISDELIAKLPYLLLLHDYFLYCVFKRMVKDGVENDEIPLLIPRLRERIEKKVSLKYFSVEEWITLSS